MLLIDGWWDHNDMFHTYDNLYISGDPAVRDVHHVLVGSR